MYTCFREMDDIQNRWYQHQQDQEQTRRQNHSNLTRLQTQDAESNSNRFSFTTTPAIAQGATFDEPAQRPYTMIDEEPMTPEAAHVSAPQQSLHTALAASEASHRTTPMASMSPQPNEKELSVAARSPHQQQISHPSQEIHPAHFAPYANPPTPPQPTVNSTAANQYHQQQHQYHYQQQQQQPQQSTTDVASSHTSEAPRAPPPMTYPPMPQSPNFQTSTDTKKPLNLANPTSTTSPGQFSLEHPDQNIYSHPAVPHSPLTPAYSPASPFGGPNTSAFHLGHRPGQVAHPLSSAPKGWHAGTLSPSGTCAASLFCACVTYGKVQYQLAQRGRKAEPTDLLAYSAANADCGLFALLAACGLCGPLAAIQRSRTRRAYAIDGGFAGDCLRGCCCCCCAVALNEREIAHREEQRRKLAGPPAAGGYTSMGRMTYPG